ncbi:MAG: DUF5050 domain-containing protein [Clostridium sp.]|uniref:DUF5050 domain-containing protein n=1 Tax=Clostridium sp. TaxID=1506 RepID=UPI0025C4049D|nr:DUF5050 domain-containing protein [Clostridium sp.]MCF0146934.1 DUF5050 domain-containing protein [Clostridium sp.]
MLKKFILPIIASSLLLVSCTTESNDVIEEKKQTNLTTSYKQNIITDKKIAFLGKSYFNNKYVFLGNLLFFPNPSNNERLSAAELSEGSTNITDDSIIDSFDYNVNSIVTDDTSIYFSSTSTDKGIFKLDYQKKEITNIINDSAIEMLYYEDKIYYISSIDNNIYTYSIKEKERKLLSSSKASNLIINNNSIFYKNLSDKAKLYCLATDGSSNFEVMDSPIDSFVINNDEILFSNSKDNNYLYSINPSNSETKKILDIKASNLKQNDNKIYFISNEDPNSLYELTQNNESNNFEATKIFSYFINDYYTSENMLFIEAAHSLDNINILSIN